MKTVNITIEGGAVQDVEAPPGVRVLIRDYDVEGTDFEENQGECGFDIRRDENGDPYQRMEFEASPDPTGSRSNSTTVDLGAVDWVLLRTQKQTLLDSMPDIAASKPVSRGVMESIYGLIHLLDHIQDQAAETIGETAAFGDLTEPSGSNEPETPIHLQEGEEPCPKDSRPKSPSAAP